MGETKQFGLEKFLPGTESYFGGTNESYVVLYIMLKADDICGDPNSLSIPSVSMYRSIQSYYASLAWVCSLVVEEWRQSEEDLPNPSTRYKNIRQKTFFTVIVYYGQ